MNTPKKEIRSVLSSVGIHQIQYAPDKKRIKQILEVSGSKKESFDEAISVLNKHLDNSYEVAVTALTILEIMDRDPCDRRMVSEMVLDIAKGDHQYHLSLLRAFGKEAYNPASPLVQHMPEECRPLLAQYNPENAAVLIGDIKYEVYADSTMRKTEHLTYKEMTPWQRDILCYPGTGGRRPLTGKHSQEQRIIWLSRDRESGHIRDCKIHVTGGRYTAHDLVAKAVETALHHSSEHLLDDTIELFENSLKKLRYHKKKRK